MSNSSQDKVIIVSTKDRQVLWASYLPGWRVLTAPSNVRPKESNKWNVCLSFHIAALPDDPTQYQMKVVVAAATAQWWHIVCLSPHYTPGAPEITDTPAAICRPMVRSNCINNTCDNVAHQLQPMTTYYKEKFIWSKNCANFANKIRLGRIYTTCISTAAGVVSYLLTGLWVAISMFILFPAYLWVYYCGHLPRAPITLAPVSLGPQRPELWRLEQGWWCYDTLTCKHYSPDALLPVLLPCSTGQLKSHHRHDRLAREGLE